MIIEKVCIIGKNKLDASGKILIIILKKPYVANFKIIAANRIEPANGASACALNNHKWKGTKGVLTAKLIKNAKKNNFF